MKHKDPVTGDTLTGGEYLSWRIQGIIRNWAFLGLITVITFAAWLTTNSIVLTWWNLCASYLALVIESIVGIAMFSQTRRDAVVLREVRAIASHIDEQDRAMLGVLTKLNSQEALILQLLDPKSRRVSKESVATMTAADRYISQVIDGSFPAPEATP